MHVTGKRTSHTCYFLQPLSNMLKRVFSPDPPRSVYHLQPYKVHAHAHTHKCCCRSIQSSVRDISSRRFLRQPFMCIVLPPRGLSPRARHYTTATRRHILPQHAHIAAYALFLSPARARTHTRAGQTPLPNICIMAADTYMSICIQLRLSRETKTTIPGENVKEVMGTDEGGRLLLLLRRRPTLVAAARVPAFGVCARGSCCAPVCRVQSVALVLMPRKVSG